MDATLYRAHGAMEESHWWFVGRRAIVASILDRYVGMVGQEPVLDLGCGTGGMLPLLSRYGPVTAVEPDAYAVARARAQPCVAEVIEGRVPDDIPAVGCYGLVTAFDVVEHLADDVGALRTMATAAREGGTVVVTVPAMSWLWSDHDVANGHHRRYHRRQLLAAMHAAGLEVRHVSYFNTVLFPPVAALRLVRGALFRRPGRNDFESGIPPKPLNALLAKLLSAERRLVTTSGLPVGVSLVAVATPDR